MSRYSAGVTAPGSKDSPGRSSLIAALATTLSDSPRFQDAADLPPGTAVERYIVLKKLGQGGMGVVYLAIDPELDRRVAIKLVHAGPAGSDDDSREARARMLREAQAMAKLSHPNVATIFDVGAFGDEVFLAMEYVSGVTLRAWLDEAPRTAREIIAVFVQAGRGLAAAHASGILHRDFKPDNVMVDAEGRARVLDFGLARVQGTIEAPTTIRERAPNRSGSPAPSLSVSDRLTRSGALMGTPAYMPPEVLEGEVMDARGDQFSFCVSMWEALYRERPYSASDVVGLVKALTRGERTDPRDRRGVPRGVHTVISRGLSHRADARYPQMGDLLDALERASAAPRRRAAAGLAVVAAVAALAIAWNGRAARPPLCAGAEQEVGEAWSDPDRAAVAAGFAASGNPRQAATWDRVRALLDAYAAGWARMRRESCEATRVRGTQSDEALDLRTACLDQRRRELKATAKLLATPKSALVDDAVTMVRALPPLDQCADVSALRAPYARPRDEAQRRAVDAIRERLASGRALFASRSLAEAESVASGAAADAVAAGYPPLEADARLLLGMSLDLRGKADEALTATLDAAILANRIHNDLTEASAWTWIVRITGFDLGRYADSVVYARLADAAIQRAGGGDALRAELVRNRGHAEYAKGDLAKALPLYREALALRERAFGADSLEAAVAQVDVADVLRNQGAVRESIVLDESVLAKREASLGEGHPAEAGVLIALVNAHETLGELDDAERAARRALAVAPQGQMRSHVRLYIARVMLAKGDVVGGEAEARGALAELAAIWGASSWKVGANRASWATTLLRRHVLTAAAAEADQAIALLAPTDQSADGLRAARAIRALCLARLGHAKGALPEAESALAAEEKASAPGSYALLLPSLAVGEAALATGDAAGAVSVLERAVAVADATEPFPELHADAHLALARALVATHGDATRARQMAERAAKEYEGVGLPDLAAEARRVAGE